VTPFLAKNRQSNRKLKKTIIGEDTAAAGQIFAGTDDGLISKTSVTTKSGAIKNGTVEANKEKENTAQIDLLENLIIIMA
jgi:hypothetical protein